MEGVIIIGSFVTSWYSLRGLYLTGVVKTDRNLKIDGLSYQILKLQHSGSSAFYYIEIEIGGVIT